MVQASRHFTRLNPPKSPALGRDYQVLRVAPVTPETEVAARTEYRLTQKVVRPVCDDAGEISPWDPGDGRFMHLPLHVFDIAWIDRSRLYLHKYLPFVRSWQGNILDTQIIQAAGLMKL